MKVVVSFITTAYFTSLILCLCFICRFIPSELLNRIDTGVTDLIWRNARFRIPGYGQSSIGTAILMFSDQKLVTGIAILTSGYVQLSNNISIYHWQVIIDLAWFSSLTHLATLTVLRQHFRENAAARIWRSVFMVLLLFMLLLALLSTGDADWSLLNLPSNAGTLPALCVFKRLFNTNSIGRYKFDALSSPEMFLSVTILIISYTSRIMVLSRLGSVLTKTWLRTKPSHVVKRAIARSMNGAKKGKYRIIFKVIHLSLKIVYVELRAIFDMYGSMLWEVSTCCLFGQTSQEETSIYGL